MERAAALVEGWILGVTGSIERPIERRKPRVRVVDSQREPKVIGSVTAKVCPECSHVFRGGTWGGIDAHWKTFHNHIMPYKEAWPIIKAGGRPSVNESSQSGAGNRR
jgi:hypothetical protein